MTKGFTFHSKGHPITIFPINTGLVSMKTAAHTIRHQNFGLRLADISLGKQFTEWLPVLCWVVVHPEGIFVIDTGYSSLVKEPGYFDKANALERWFTRTQVRVDINKKDELIPQLELLGIVPKQVKSVILTHLHVDHVGGISGMPGVPFLVNEMEYAHNSQDFLLPEWFSPVKIRPANQSVGSFRQSFPITDSGDMQLVFTPGHTKGHCSVLLQTDEEDILFAGDIAYSQEQLINNKIAAPNDLKTSLESYKAIKEYAARRPLIFLPSHDTDAVERLEKRAVLNTCPSGSQNNPGNNRHLTLRQ